MFLHGKLLSFLQEKYNVWIALLNMEHKYGSMETLEKAFTSAVAESKVKFCYIFNLSHL